MKPEKEQDSLCQQLPALSIITIVNYQHQSQSPQEWGHFQQCISRSELESEKIIMIKQKCINGVKYQMLQYWMSVMKSSIKLWSNCQSNVKYSQNWKVLPLLENFHPASRYSFGTRNLLVWPGWLRLPLRKIWLWSWSKNYGMIIDSNGPEKTGSPGNGNCKAGNDCLPRMSCHQLTIPVGNKNHTCRQKK